MLDPFPCRVRTQIAVQIPLDYYRILGLPIQATPDQLQQAHRDRLQQKPRREYSESAVAARTQLIEEAFQTLADEVLRQRYDTKFLSPPRSDQPGDQPGDRLGDQPSEATIEATADAARSEHLEPSPERSEATGRSTFADRSSDRSFERGADRAELEPITPTIEVDRQGFIGALLILLELGEYETVLKLGRVPLSQPQTVSEPASYKVLRSDIVLATATAYLEIGREQWQQKNYEKAAASLEAGQALLLREGLFPQVRGEMQRDLRKLRPYRVLELLALQLDRDVPRQRGFQLLRDMLQERGGIDGKGDDQSGLGIDEFLRFIQQLRQHTTVAEQQLLFEIEARRPSAVAMYLAAYALITRGFVQRQPGLVYRARGLLIQLGRRQDVHLEQAVCSLLLGQTDRATRSLDLSQEEDSLRFIRHHSQGSPDLLPGLCLYGEQWLQDDVFPHFRDLKHRTASLKDYFADPQVQSHLENLPPEAEVSDRWLEVGRRPLPRLQTGINAAAQAAPPIPTPQIPTSQRSTSQIPAPQPLGMASPMTATSPELATTIGAVPHTTEQQHPPTSKTSKPPLAYSPDGLSNTGLGNTGLSNTGTEANRPPTPLELPIAEVSRTNAHTPHTRHRRRSRLRLDRLILVSVVGLLGLGVMGFLLVQLLSGIANAMRGLTGPQIEGTPLALDLDRPVIAIPVPDPNQIDPEAPTTGQLTPELANSTIATWLKIKRQALGEKHDVAALQEILLAPALGQYEQLANDAKAGNWHWLYEHEVKDVSITKSPSDASNVSNADGAAAVPSSGQTPDQAMGQPRKATPSTNTSSANKPGNTSGSNSSATGQPSEAEIKATVIERGQLFEGGQAIETSNTTLIVRYQIQQQGDRWYIRDWSVESES